MKKLLIAILVLLAVMGGLVFMLLRSADAKNLQRTPAVIEMPDTFEK